MTNSRVRDKIASIEADLDKASLAVAVLMSNLDQDSDEYASLQCLFGAIVVSQKFALSIGK